MRSDPERSLSEKALCQYLPNVKLADPGFLLVTVMLLWLPSIADAAPAEDISALMRENNTKAARELVDSCLTEKNLKPETAFELLSLGVENFFLAKNSTGAAIYYARAKDVFRKMKTPRSKDAELRLSQMESELSRRAAQVYMELIAGLETVSDRAYFGVRDADELYKDIINDRGRFVANVARARYDLYDGDPKAARELLETNLKLYPDLVRKNQVSQSPDTNLNRAIQYAYLFLADACIRENDLQHAEHAIRDYLSRIDVSYRPALGAWFNSVLLKQVAAKNVEKTLTPILKNACQAIRTGQAGTIQALMLPTAKQYETIPQELATSHGSSIKECLIDEVFIDTLPQAGSRAYITYRVVSEGTGGIQLNDAPMDIEKRHQMPDAWQAYLESTGSGPTLNRVALKSKATFQFDGVTWKIEYIDY